MHNHKIAHPFCSDPVKFYTDPGYYAAEYNNMKETCKRLTRAMNPKVQIRGLDSPRKVKIENNIIVGYLTRPGS